MAAAPALMSSASISGVPRAAKSLTQSRTAGATRPSRTASTGASAISLPVGFADGGDANARVEMIDGGKEEAGVEEDVVVGAAPGEVAPLGDDRRRLRRGEKRDIALVPLRSTATRRSTRRSAIAAA